MKIKKNKKNLPIIIGAAIALLVGGFIAYKKGFLAVVLNTFKKKAA